MAYLPISSCTLAHTGSDSSCEPPGRLFVSSARQIGSFRRIHRSGFEDGTQLNLDRVQSHVLFCKGLLTVGSPSSFGRKDNFAQSTCGNRPTTPKWTLMHKGSCFAALVGPAVSRSKNVLSSVYHLQDRPEFMDSL